jgi:hypothetical protein
VNGIKRTAKERDVARMMFCGGAVRLRGGQLVSKKVVSRQYPVFSKTDICCIPFSHEFLPGVGPVCGDPADSTG